MTHRLNRIL